MVRAALAGFLTAWLGFFAAIVLGPPQSALAVSCLAPYGESISARETINSHYGAIASDILVVDPSSTCPMLREVEIDIDLGNTMEVGWYEDGTAGSFSKCDDVSHPHVFVYAIVDGFIKCKSGTEALTAGDTYSFRVQNTNHDKNWHYFFGSINEGYYSTKYNTGPVYSNSERHLTGENLHSHFVGLGWFGQSGNWNLWTSITPLVGVSDWSYCAGPDAEAYSVKQTC